MAAAPNLAEELDNLPQKYEDLERELEDSCNDDEYARLQHLLLFACRYRADPMVIDVTNLALLRRVCRCLHESGIARVADMRLLGHGDVAKVVEKCPSLPHQLEVRRMVEFVQGLNRDLVQKASGGVDGHVPSGSSAFARGSGGSSDGVILAVLKAKTVRKLHILTEGKKLHDMSTKKRNYRAWMADVQSLVEACPPVGESVAEAMKEQHKGLAIDIDAVPTAESHLWQFINSKITASMGTGLETFIDFHAKHNK